MEPVVTVAEGEWSSLSGIYTSEEADFMAQLLGNVNGDSRINIEIDRQESPNADFPSTHYWSVQLSSNLNIPRVYENETSQFYSSNFANPSTNYLSPSGGFDAGNVSINLSSSCYVGDKSNPILAASNDSMSMVICGGTEAGNGSSRDVGGNDFLNQEMNECNVEESSASLAKTSMQVKEESEVPGQEPASNVSSESSKKRSRSIPNAQKTKRNIRSRKKSLSLNDLTSQNEEDGNNGNGNGQSSSTCCSEEDSQDQMGGATSTSKELAPAPLNSNGKTRAGRGSATDPQSLYARKRRERINERLRILQNLIPNGTKVDISTMLEEAVRYVKFLQLQIKLLSSDDLWMYAPIAYNGIDIGLDFNINTPR